MGQQSNPEHDEAVRLALAEYRRLLAAGGTVDREKFLAQYPKVSVALEALLPSAECRPDSADAGDRRNKLEDAASKPPADPLDETLPLAGDQVPSEPHELPVRQFGEYELIEELGRGGMGVVYRARQASINRIVAVKMILAGRLASRTSIERFYAEAHSAGKLNHPHIVDVYHAGEIGGHHYFSMEYVRGLSLAKLASQGPLPPSRAAKYLLATAEAVHFAHEHGVLHRDLKPSNILIDARDEPRITDFGLAKDTASQQGLTSTGQTLGTPSYMSPEQAQGNHVDRRSDVYSLGAILYELQTGRRPFEGSSVAATLMQAIDEDPVPPSAVIKTCNRDLEAICLKCLCKNPKKRYATAADLAADIKRFIKGQPVHARRLTRCQRMLSWANNIPLLRALTGQRSSGSTIWHFRFQWLFILAFILLGGVGLALPSMLANWRLHVVDFSAGPETGTYFQIATELSEGLSKIGTERIQIRPSQGSVESHDKLRRREVDLALLQENAISAPDAVQIVAPLYYEVAIVLADKQSGIERIQQLPGRSVFLGTTGSGMRLNSERILQHFEIHPSQLQRTDANWEDFLNGDQLEAGIVTGHRQSHDLAALLATERFVPIPIPRGDEIPGFRSTVLLPEDVPGLDLPPSGMQTVQTMAVLATRRDVPDWFVTRCLRALYDGDGIRAAHLFSSEYAAAWQELNLHPASQRFYGELVDNK